MRLRFLKGEENESRQHKAIILIFRRLQQMHLSHFSKCDSEIFLLYFSLLLFSELDTAGFDAYLDHFPHLSDEDSGCEKSISFWADEGTDLLNGCTICKLPRLDDLRC